MQVVFLKIIFKSECFCCFWDGEQNPVSTSRIWAHEGKCVWKHRS